MCRRYTYRFWVEKKSVMLQGDKQFFFVSFEHQVLIKERTFKTDIRFGTVATDIILLFFFFFVCYHV